MPATFQPLIDWLDDDCGGLKSRCGRYHIRHAKDRLFTAHRFEHIADTWPVEDARDEDGSVLELPLSAARRWCVARERQLEQEAMRKLIRKLWGAA